MPIKFQTGVSTLKLQYQRFFQKLVDDNDGDEDGDDSSTTSSMSSSSTSSKDHKDTYTTTNARKVRPPVPIARHLRLRLRLWQHRRRCAQAETENDGDELLSSAASPVVDTITRYPQPQRRPRRSVVFNLEANEIIECETFSFATTLAQEQQRQIDQNSDWDDESDDDADEFPFALRQRSDIWYNRDELKDMKQQAMNDAGDFLARHPDALQCQRILGHIYEESCTSSHKTWHQHHDQQQQNTRCHDYTESVTDEEKVPFDEDWEAPPPQDWPRHLGRFVYQGEMGEFVLGLERFMVGQVLWDDRRNRRHAIRTHLSRLQRAGMNPWASTQSDRDTSLTATTSANTTLTQEEEDEDDRILPQISLPSRRFVREIALGLASSLGEEQQQQQQQQQADDDDDDDDDDEEEGPQLSPSAKTWPQLRRPNPHR